MNRLPIERENEILASDLRDTQRALAQIAHMFGITSSGYVGEAPNRYHIYTVNDDCTEFSAIHVDENGRRVFD